jgi:hypothetical protein
MSKNFLFAGCLVVAMVMGVGCVELPDPIKELNVRLVEVKAPYFNALKLKASADATGYNDVPVSEFGVEVSIDGSAVATYRVKSRQLNALDSIAAIPADYGYSTNTYTARAYAIMGTTTYYSTSQAITLLAPPCDTFVFQAGAIETGGQVVVAGGTPTTIGSAQDASCKYGTVSYQWYRNSTPIGNATAATYTPSPSDATAVDTITYTRSANDNRCNDTLKPSQGQWIMTVTPTLSVPVFSQIACSAKTARSLTMLATISSDNGYSITERGFCYSTTVANPTIADGKVAAVSSGVGAYTVVIDGLKANTCYYVRAYARNAAGVAYWGGSGCVKTNSE